MAVFNGMVKSKARFLVSPMTLGRGDSPIKRLGGKSALVMLFAVIVSSPQPAAWAGDITKVEGVTSYNFTKCQAPESPALSIDPAKKGNASVRDYNAQVSKMNVYLGLVRTYMECLSQEADSDLEAYYNAVSDSLIFEQERMDEQVGDLRRVLSAGPNRAERRQRRAPASSPASSSIPALEGAEPLPEEATPAPEEKQPNKLISEPMAAQSSDSITQVSSQPLK